MTTDARTMLGVMTTETVARSVPGALPWRRALIVSGVALLGLIALGGGFAFGYQEAFSGRAVPGVSVGGVAIGGLDRAAAESRLRATLPSVDSGSLVLVSGSATERVSFARLGRAYDYRSMLDAALAYGHGADLPAALQQDVQAALAGESVAPQVTYDPAALASAVASVAAGHDVAPVSASVVLAGNGQFAVRPAVEGVSVDRQAAAAAAATGLASPDAADVTVRLVTTSTAPAVTTAQAEAAMRTAQQMTSQPLSLTVSNDAKFSATVPVATLRGWITFGSPLPGGVVPAPAAPSPSSKPGAPASASPAASPSPTASTAAPSPAAPASVPPTPASSPAPGVSTAPSAAGYVALVSAGPVRTTLAAFAPKLDRAPADAQYLLGNGRVVGVLAGRNGSQLDVEASVNAVVAALELRAAGTPAPAAGLVTASVTPKVTTDTAKQTAPLMKMVGSWTTYFVPGIANYWGRNIAIPAAKIDGYVVAPGAWFDFWQVVGYPTLAEGYGMGGAIINGHTQEQGAIAGGICSTSTTLFNAALRAGYEIGDRANHYYYISRYPVGLDATVAIWDGGEQDMTWRNDTPYPVLIHAINGPGTVTFQLFSVDLHRTVTLSTPVVKNYTYATTDYSYVTTLAPGQTEQVEYPANGFDSWVTRVVRDASGAVIHQETYYSHYALVNGLIEVGVAKGSTPSPTPTPKPSPTPSPSPSAHP